MLPVEFAYEAVLKFDGSGTVTSLIAYELQSTLPLRAVLWSVPSQAWIYAPGPASTFLYDPEYEERTRQLDREAAEQLAVTTLGTELPSVEELLALCDYGEQMGWDYGPPLR